MRARVDRGGDGARRAVGQREARDAVHGIRVTAELCFAHERALLKREAAAHPFRACATTDSGKWRGVTGRRGAKVTLDSPNMGEGYGIQDTLVCLASDVSGSMVGRGAYSTV